MIEEIWKDIEGFEGLYQVSNLGRVRSLKGGKTYVFKEHRDRQGYSYGFLYIGRNHKPRQLRYKTHKLVAKYFCDGYEEGLVVDHIDGNKQNNVYTNLEWVTPSENNRRAYALGLKSRVLSERQKTSLGYGARINEHTHISNEHTHRRKDCFQIVQGSRKEFRRYRYWDCL